MAMRKLKNINWILIIAIVAIFFVIGIFWNIERRRKIFGEWKLKIARIRHLRLVLYGKYQLKKKLDRRTMYVFNFFKVIGIGFLFGFAQWLHWEYGLIWYGAIGAAFTVIAATFHSIVFMFFAKKYSVAETIEFFRCELTFCIYRAGKLDPKTIMLIEKEIDKLEIEAIGLKQQLRPEAQLIR